MSDFNLIRKKVKNISIKIKSSKIIVVAPKNISLEFIENLLISKSNWIKKAKELCKKKEAFFNKNNFLNFCEDETIFFLGKDYKIKILESDKNFINLENDAFIFFLKPENNSFEYKKKLFKNWLKINETIVFKKILVNVYNRYFSKILNKIPNLKIRKMKSTWGICNYKKETVTLNSELIKCNIDIISYILVHEFVHFFHQNHSKNFYKLLKTILPEYKKYENKLKNIS